MPNLLPSMVSTTASAKAPLPSASMVMSSDPSLLFQPAMTNGSLTEMPATSSIPLALSSAAFSTYDGRWRAEQVGVNAPGTANKATRLSAKNSPLVVGCGPSGVAIASGTSGMLSPTDMVMQFLLGVS